MGTTCTLILLEDGSAHLAHVGDSRAYLYRAGQLTQVTEDHNLVGKMLSEGRLSREEAAHHPQRNIITRALGLDPDVEVDLMTLDVHENDRLIICSDGLSSMVEEEALAQVLSDENDPQAVAEQLVDDANQAGGEDNITVVVIDVRGDSGEQIAPPPVARTRTPTESPVAEEGGGRGWGRRLAWGVLVMALLVGGAIAARWFVLGHAWFVGTNAAGVITIYKGIPDEVAGVSLKKTQQETALKVSSLPQFLRSNVMDGIKVDSYGAAQTTIRNLRQRIKEFTKPTPTPSPSKKNSQK
jgi:protein phosphatase